MSWIEAIQERVSWRSFTKEPLDTTLSSSLRDFANELSSPPFGGICRFSILTNQDEEFFKKLGTYGMIRGAADYLAPVIKRSEYDLEDFGYLVEQIVLRATQLGIGTCWLGGSFTKENFAKAVSLKEDEIIPAVIALGRPRSSRTIVDSLVRFGAKSKMRKPSKELFFKECFGSPLSVDGPLARVLDTVRMAPSASNQQPWRIVQNDRGLHFFIQRSQKYQKTLKRFKLFDLQRTDLGIALAHFDLASKELGLRGEFSKVEPGLTDIPLDASYLVSWIS